MAELCDLPAVELRRLIGARRISPLELTLPLITRSVPIVELLGVDFPTTDCDVSIAMPPPPDDNGPIAI